MSVRLFGQGVMLIASSIVTKLVLTGKIKGADYATILYFTALLITRYFMPLVIGSIVK
jgi:hypothetical protein